MSSPYTNSSNSINMEINELEPISSSVGNDLNMITNNNDNDLSYRVQPNDYQFI